ncbi:hypothetical protein VPHK469_0162 [Vibrio phage K469]
MSLTTDQIKERVDAIIKGHFGVSEDVEPASSLYDQFDAVDIDALELVMALEEEFDTELSNYDDWECDNNPEEITPEMLYGFVGEYEL